jgi:small basic protein
MIDTPRIRLPHILLSAIATSLVLAVAEKVLYFQSVLLGCALALAGPLALSVLLFKNRHTKRRGVIATYLLIAVIGLLLFAWKWGAEIDRANW